MDTGGFVPLEKKKKTTWQFYRFVKTMFWGAVVQPNGRSLYGRLKIALQCVKMSGSVFNRTPWNSIFAARQKRQNRNSTYFWTTYLADLFSCTLGFLLVRFLFYVSVFGDGLRSKGCWWKEMTQNMSILLWSKITGIWQAFISVTWMCRMKE